MREDPPETAKPNSTKVRSDDCTIKPSAWKARSAAAAGNNSVKSIRRKATSSTNKNTAAVGQVGPERHGPRRGRSGTSKTDSGCGVEPPARAPPRSTATARYWPAAAAARRDSPRPGPASAGPASCVSLVWLNINWYEPGRVVSNSAWYRPGATWAISIFCVASCGSTSVSSVAARFKNLPDGLDGVERDDRLAALPLDLNERSLGLGLAQGVADDLGPELAELGPGQPLGRPAGLGVGGERHAHAQAVAPPGQERVARLGRQDHLGGRLGPGHDVAQQERRLVEPDLGEHLGRADDRRAETAAR